MLDVRHDASPEEIKRRWRELAREHHPDRAGADAEERERLTTRMARINAAYDVLSDSVRRARYDSTPHARRERYAEGRAPGSDEGRGAATATAHQAGHRALRLLRLVQATQQHGHPPTGPTHHPVRSAAGGLA